MNKKEFKTKVFGIIVDYVHDDLFNKDTCVKSIDELYDWIETHTQKKVEEEHQKLLDILEHNKDPMTGLYDYDGIAQEVIDLVKKYSL